MSSALHTKTFPRSRLSTIDLGKIGVKKHHVVALLEVDVTRARRALRTRNRGGESSVSLLAWLARSIAVSLSRHPQVHALRTGRRRTTSFDTVTASLMVEREVEGVRVPFPFVVEAVESKPLTEIEASITHARTGPIASSDFVVGRRGSQMLTSIFYALPGFMRRWLVTRVVRNPRRVQRMMGSVVITSIGMGGRVRGWFIPRSMHPVCIGIGAVAPKATVINGRIEPREVLHMTVLVDHDVVDGAPAARWISDLVRTLEQAKEIDDWQN